MPPYYAALLCRQNSTLPPIPYGRHMSVSSPSWRRDAELCSCDKWQVALCEGCGEHARVTMALRAHARAC
eukprot:1060168-Pyramimonas_sp.AAC.2